MCLIVFALGRSERFPLVVAANRDEFFERPAAPLAWWGTPPILAGRDLQAGGAWLGLTAAGRLAMLTNIRRPGSQREQAPSRGDIVPLWLRGEHSPQTFCAALAGAGHNPFNCIAADLAEGAAFYTSADQLSPQTLAPGLYGLSNAALDTPWPKVERLKAQLQHALDHAASAAELATAMFDALADKGTAPDDQLPATGVPLDWERLLSAPFIHAPQRGYGTRCSTVVISERTGAQQVAHVIEQSFTAHAEPAQRQQLTLAAWPGA